VSRPGRSAPRHRGSDCLLVWPIQSGNEWGRTSCLWGQLRGRVKFSDAEGEASEEEACEAWGWWPPVPSDRPPSGSHEMSSASVPGPNACPFAAATSVRVPRYIFRRSTCGVRLSRQLQPEAPRALSRQAPSEAHFEDGERMRKKQGINRIMPYF